MISAGIFRQYDIRGVVGDDLTIEGAEGIGRGYAAVLAERATFLLAATMGKQKAGRLVEEALAKGGSFVETLGRLETALSDEAALLGHSPTFVGRLLAELKKKAQTAV